MMIIIGVVGWKEDIRVISECNNFSARNQHLAREEDDDSSPPSGRLILALKSGKSFDDEVSQFLAYRS